jgi:hypothetical protein
MWLSQAVSSVHPLSHEKFGAGKHLKMDNFFKEVMASMFTKLAQVKFYY